MQVALGLAALFIGIDLAIAGITKRSFSRLVMGNWDAPGATTTSTTTAPATAATGGANGQTGATSHPTLASVLGGHPVGP